MNKGIKDNIQKIGEILLKLIVNVLVDSIGLYSAVNLFLIAFKFSFRLEFIQAVAIILLFFILSSIFGRKESSK